MAKDGLSYILHVHENVLLLLYICVLSLKMLFMRTFKRL